MGTLVNSIITKQLGLTDYESVWESMKDFTQTRDQNTPDEIWIVEHPPTFTLGRNGKEHHILQETSIPIVKVDRGGQVTYHGPGQIVIYLLLDLHRRSMGIRQLVTLIENCIIELLADYQITAYSDAKAPGVYVDKKKIAALGLRVSKGRTTHGLSLNVEMDLTPFQYINPCGYEGLEITQCVDLGIKDSMPVLSEMLNSIIKSEIIKASESK
ncbi:lipoyl(octanoyl) transferase LipB [uncultured Cocleimonas sp.]|uniref:lipoyl(octanoyl) transferase LipB n=1 Tax=uncultured Cocleimonas sp. TaxID=1051587 RepID=UPI00262B3DC7|nr:lipoyl(octanoyl) transferase LipB [uncultured Cocleimonas sp.]